MAKDREKLESLIAELKNELGIATTLHLMLMLQITSRATENAFYAGMRNGVTADDPKITRGVDGREALGETQAEVCRRTEHVKRAWGIPWWVLGEGVKQC